MQENLTKEVRHQLLLLPYYSVFDNLMFKVDGDKVTLLGQVVRPTLKSDAEAAVKGIEGVASLDNQIEVLPVSPMDDQLRRAVYRALYTDASLSKYGWSALPSIHIIVKNGHVTLEGVVDSESDKNLANLRANGVPNVFSKVGDWRALEDAMPAPCHKTDVGTYAPRHNPPTYYTNLAATCAARDVPLGATIDLSARLTFITPDLNNDTHDTPVAYGDAWLSKLLPRLFATPEYQSGTTAVFLTWDEDDGSAANQIPTFVFAPSVPPGTAVGTRFDHYSMLRTTEEMLGLPAPYLGRAATAASMAAAFRLLP